MLKSPKGYDFNVFSRYFIQRIEEDTVPDPNSITIFKFLHCKPYISFSEHPSGLIFLLQNRADMSLSIHMIFIEKRQDLSDQQPPQRELLQNFLHYALFLLTSSDSSHQALSIDIVFVPILPHLDKFCRILFNIFV